MAATREHSFIMVKHDGVQRGLVGDIISRFEKRGFKLVATKLIQVCPDHSRHSSLTLGSF